VSVLLSTVLLLLLLLLLLLWPRGICEAHEFFVAWRRHCRCARTLVVWCIWCGAVRSSVA